jgi:hypothetical protein
VRPQVCAQFQAQAGTTAGNGILNKMLRCLAPWMRHVALPIDQLASSALIPFGFRALGEPALFDAASDLIVETLHYTSDQDHHELVPRILPAIIDLVPQYDAAVQREDEECARALCRIFAEAGEQCTSPPSARHIRVRSLL